MEADKLPEIHGLSEVVEPHFSGARLTKYRTSMVTQPGENYGSVLLAIHAQLQRLDGELFEEQLVAKIPPTDPKYWQFFQPERTCLTENAVYKVLAPALTSLQDEVGIPAEKQFKGERHCARLPAGKQTQAVQSGGNGAHPELVGPVPRPSHRSASEEAAGIRGICATVLQEVRHE